MEELCEYTKKMRGRERGERKDESQKTAENSFGDD